LDPEAHTANLTPCFLSDLRSFVLSELRAWALLPD